MTGGLIYKAKFFFPTFYDLKVNGSENEKCHFMIYSYKFYFKYLLQAFLCICSKDTKVIVFEQQAAEREIDLEKVLKNIKYLTI